jgi:uncharacterized protein (TIGR02147 family)
MKSSVFEYSDYKKYLSIRLATQGPTRGFRARLAAILRCRAAYISQVLNGPTDFSLEHAILIDQYLEHTSEESHYFILLVQYGRAGSKNLEAFFARQMENIKSNREIISKRIKGKQVLSLEDQVVYYGRWYYSAIHTLLLIPQYQTKQAIANYLSLPLSTVSEVLDFLLSKGFAREEKGKFVSGNKRTHLGTDSPLLPKHHMNWRVKTIQSLDRKPEGDLHYSGSIALSIKSAERIKTILLESIERMEPVIRETGEEAAFCVCLDFFKI